MKDIIQYLNLVSAGSAALCLLVGLLFVKSPSGWVRIFVIAIAALAIATPVIYLRTIWGMPSPWLEDGRYRLLGWKADEEAGQIYVMVTHPRFDTPREYQVPFDLDVALQLQDIRSQKDFEELICMQYDSAAVGKPAVELRRLQSAINDIYQSCDLMWK